MALPITSTMRSKLDGAAASGLDIAFVAVVEFGGVVGSRYFATREIPVGIVPPGGASWSSKLMQIPPVTRRSDPSAIRFDALNDDITVRLQNTLEAADGGVDPARLQDLMAQSSLLGKMVKLGVVDIRGTAWADIKWDAVYRVDRVDRNEQTVSLYCVDWMLHPGEKMIGATINDQDWPAAPESSYGQVRGAVFGKVEQLPLIPVEVGLSASLAAEIDAQDGIVDIVADEIDLWPSSGFVEVGDEVVYYPVIDRELKRLGAAGSPCLRGAGFPYTAAVSHAAGVIVTEAYTGRRALLNTAITASSTLIELLATDVFPASGVLLIEEESIVYSALSGTIATGVQRGMPVPTIAKVHNMGTSVRTFPLGPDGKPRYRYVVAQGDVAAVEHLQVHDETGDELPYSGDAPVLSQVTGENGTVWTVADLASRARFDKYENSASRVAPEWVMETTGEVDPEGVALASSFLRWQVGAGMSPEHLATWPRAIDPNASTRAVILEATPGKNVFSVEFDARWDGALNDPRKKFGRFRDARLRVKVQYDRQTNTVAQFEVYTNTLLVKSGTFMPPTNGGGVGGGMVIGQQELPMSRWGTQVKNLDVRLSSRTTSSYTVYNSGYWINPMTTTANVTNGSFDHSAVTSGDTRQFLSGGWHFPVIPNGPWYGGTSRPMQRELVYDEIQQKYVLTGYDVGPLELYSNNTFPEASSGDRLKRLIVTIHNPTGTPEFEELVQTGWKGTLTLHSDEDFSGTKVTKTIHLNVGTQDKYTLPFALDGLKWTDLQSLKLRINQYTGLGGDGSKGATVGQIFIAVEYEPDVEGQRVGTIVDGSYFHTTATTTPSAVFGQMISLGRVAKDAGRTYGVDPWLMWTNVLGSEGFRFVVKLPEAGDGLQFAVADVALELEYEAQTVVFDGLVRADVDGRSGTPVGGGSTAVLENATDVLAYLVDESEFYGLAGAREATSWADARELTELAGWRVARAITEPISVRELAASLAAESRQVLLQDGLQLYCRSRAGEAQLSDSLRTVGDQAEPAYALANKAVQVVNRREDIANTIGCYYRRNYLTGDYRGVIEEKDQDSIDLYGVVRATPNLDWHQSARGYSGGLAEQRSRLRWLTQYMIDMAARQWDYTSIELPVSAVEDLQRGDVITVNRPQSGYFNAPGRVVSLQRLTGPLRWQVTLQMSGATGGGEEGAYIWRSVVDERTYIKLSESGSRMDFVASGSMVAQLTSGGDLLVAGDATEQWAGAGVNTKVDAGTDIRIYRERPDSAIYDFEERIRFSRRADGGNVVFWGRMDLGLGQTVETGAPGVIPNLGGVAGIVDTASSSVAGRVEFYLANSLVMMIDADGTWLKGDLITNATSRMGSA